MDRYNPGDMLDAQARLNGSSREHLIEIHYGSGDRRIVDLRRVIERYVTYREGQHPIVRTERFEPDKPVSADYIDYCWKTEQPLHIAARTGEKLTAEMVGMKGVIFIRNLNPDCRHPSKQES